MKINVTFENHPWELAWVYAFSTEKYVRAQAKEDIALGLVTLCIEVMNALEQLNPSRGVTPADGISHERATAEHQDGHQPR